ncbi:MAG: hypothetical protein OEL76_01505 [Siculibacillus sp.]|nr:hypothetical protein [Siculibacillus sp.]
MKRKLALAALTALPLLALPAAASPGDGVQWFAGDGRFCGDVCRARNMSPVVSGIHVPGGRQTNDQFTVCATDMNGYRPGYNLKPNWAKACWVGYGGKEVAAPNYLCACE